MLVALSYSPKLCFVADAAREEKGIARSRGCLDGPLALYLGKFAAGMCPPPCVSETGDFEQVEGRRFVPQMQ